MCELVLSGKINLSIPVRLHIKIKKGFAEGEKPPTTTYTLYTQRQILTGDKMLAKLSEALQNLK